MGIILEVAALSVGYAIVVTASVLLLRRAGISDRRAILLGFLACGALTGLLAALAWPFDSTVLFNWPAVLVGDQVYGLAIQHLGDPSSASAHSTIPWTLRVPQVYLLVALLLSGLAGAALQWVYNTIMGRSNGT